VRGAVAAVATLSGDTSTAVLPISGTAATTSIDPDPADTPTRATLVATRKGAGKPSFCRHAPKRAAPAVVASATSYTSAAQPDLYGVASGRQRYGGAQAAADSASTATASPAILAATAAPSANQKILYVQRCGRDEIAIPGKRVDAIFHAVDGGRGDRAAGGQRRQRQSPHGPAHVR